MIKMNDRELKHHIDESKVLLHNADKKLSKLFRSIDTIQGDIYIVHDRIKTIERELKIRGEIK